VFLLQNHLIFQALASSSQTKMNRSIMYYSESKNKPIISHPEPLVVKMYLSW